MHTFRSNLTSALLTAALLVFCTTANAQNSRGTSGFGGNYVARAFAYGINPSVAPLTVGIGTTVTGSGTVTLTLGNIVTPDAVVLMPLSTNAPILIGSETVTPSAVSCTTPAIYQTCAVTATFAAVHGTGELVSSGTAGLQEAINFAKTQGGGYVEIDAAWAAMGGTNALITAATAFSTVAIDDYRAGTNVSMWSMQPTTLTSLAAPATLAAGTAVFSATPAGTWTNAAQFLCVTYVDALGGEGPCSATFNATPAASTSLTITSPAASTGAVGWRAYGGASYNAAFLLPITAATCTLTALESVMPACAIGSNGFFSAIFVNTAILRPNAQSPVVNLNLPMPQGHTTFAYEPTAISPLPYQANFGPFPAFGALTAGQIAVLGSANLPAGYLNVIGRTVRVSGKLALTTVNTLTVPTLTVSAGWVGGTTAGAPVSVCAFVPAAAGATSTQNQFFSCTITTNAVGATAVGSVMTNGYEMLVAAAGGALLGATIDTGVAAIGSLGLFAQDTLFVTFTSTANVAAGEQLLDLHIETLQ